MAKQMQHDEALHLEVDIGIDRDLQPVKDASPRRFQIAIFDREAVLDDPRSDFQPQIDHVGRRQAADEPMANEFVSRNLDHCVALSAQGSVNDTISALVITEIVYGNQCARIASRPTAKLKRAFRAVERGQQRIGCLERQIRKLDMA